MMVNKNTIAGRIHLFPVYSGGTSGPSFRVTRLLKDTGVSPSQQSVAVSGSHLTTIDYMGPEYTGVRYELATGRLIGPSEGSPTYPELPQVAVDTKRGYMGGKIMFATYLHEDSGESVSLNDMSILEYEEGIHWRGENKPRE